MPFDLATWPADLDRYRPYLALLARLHLGSRVKVKVDVEDVVQETFLVAFERRQQFAGNSEAELLGWLRQVLATRLSRVYERYLGAASRDVRREVGQLIDDLDRSSQYIEKLFGLDGSTPSQNAMAHEQSLSVSAALGRLPADYRDVLVHRHFEGLSFPQIAERMGRSVGAVTMLWTRAVREFRAEVPVE